MEINKREAGRFWQRPGNILWIYVLAMLASLWFWQWAQRLTQEQMPYSEFLHQLDKGDVKEVLLTDHVISGTLTETDTKTHTSRACVTQRPYIFKPPCDLRYTVERAANTLAAYIGEVEDRMETRMGDRGATAAA